MNQQFIQSLSIDWNKIEDDSYLREIEAINNCFSAFYYSGKRPSYMILNSP